MCAKRLMPAEAPVGEMRAKQIDAVPWGAWLKTRKLASFLYCAVTYFHPRMWLQIASTAFLHLRYISTVVVHKRLRRKERVLMWLNKLLTDRHVADLQSVWRDGSILCALISILVPAARSPDSTTSITPAAAAAASATTLRRGQEMVFKHLGVPPAFNDDELQQVTFSLHFERRLLRYLSAIQLVVVRQPSLAVCSSFPPNIDTPINTNCIARGMGLFTATQHHSATIYVYFLDMHLNLGDVIVVIQSHHDFGFVRIGHKNSYSLPKKYSNIPMNFHVERNCLRLTFTPQSYGVHEATILRKGIHIPGSPFSIPVEKSDKKQTLNTNLGDNKKKEPRKRLRVLLRIVDFVTEKMLLTEEGKLKSLSSKEILQLQSSSSVRDDRSARNSPPCPSPDLDIYMREDGARMVELWESYSESPDSMLDTGSDTSSGRSSKLGHDTARCIEAPRLQSSSNGDKNDNGDISRDAGSNPATATSRQRESTQLTRELRKKYTKETPWEINSKASKSKYLHRQDNLTSPKRPLEKKGYVKETDVADTYNLRKDGIDKITANGTEFKSRCKRIIAVCNFLLSCSSRQKSLEILAAAGNILNGRPIRVSREMEKFLQNISSSIAIGDGARLLSSRLYQTHSPNSKEQKHCVARIHPRTSMTSSTSTASTRSSTRTSAVDIINDEEVKPQHVDMIVNAKSDCPFIRSSATDNRGHDLVARSLNNVDCGNARGLSDIVVIKSRLRDTDEADTCVDVVVLWEEVREEEQMKESGDSFIKSWQENRSQEGIDCRNLNLEEELSVFQEWPTLTIDELDVCNLKRDAFEIFTWDEHSAVDNKSIEDVEDKNEKFSLVPEVLMSSETLETISSIKYQNEESAVHLSSLINEATSLSVNDGPVSTSSPSCQTGVSVAFPDVDAYLSEDFTAYMLSETQFHLWPTDGAFGDGQDTMCLEDDAIVDFDSVISAPNLEEALIQLEHGLNMKNLHKLKNNGNVIKTNIDIVNVNEICEESIDKSKQETCEESVIESERCGGDEVIDSFSEKGIYHGENKVMDLENMPSCSRCDAGSGLAEADEKDREVAKERDVDTKSSCKSEACPNKTPRVTDNKSIDSVADEDRDSLPDMARGIVDNPDVEVFSSPSVDADSSPFADGENLSPDYWDSAYLSFDDLHNSVKNSPDNRLNDEIKVNNGSENHAHKGNETGEQMGDVWKEERNSAITGFMGPAEKEIWGFQEDGEVGAGEEEQYCDWPDTMRYYPRILTPLLNKLPSIGEEEEQVNKVSDDETREQREGKITAVLNVEETEENLFNSDCNVNELVCVSSNIEEEVTNAEQRNISLEVHGHENLQFYDNEEMDILPSTSTHSPVCKEAVLYDCSTYMDVNNLTLIDCETTINANAITDNIMIKFDVEMMKDEINFDVANAFPVENSLQIEVITQVRGNREELPEISSLTLDVKESDLEIATSLTTETLRGEHETNQQRLEAKQPGLLSLTQADKNTFVNNTISVANVTGFNDSFPSKIKVHQRKQYWDQKLLLLTKSSPENSIKQNVQHPKYNKLVTRFQTAVFDQINARNDVPVTAERVKKIKQSFEDEMACVSFRKERTKHASPFVELKAFEETRVVSEKRHFWNTLVAAPQLQPTANAPDKDEESGSRSPSLYRARPAFVSVDIDDDDIPVSATPPHTPTRDEWKIEMQKKINSRDVVNQRRSQQIISTAASSARGTKVNKDEIRSRFETAKHFFQTLEQNKSTGNLITTGDARDEPKRRPKLKRHRGSAVQSAPTSDSETATRTTKPNTSPIIGGSERIKISERFHVKDLFKDVLGSAGTVGGGFTRGVPHMEAVLKSLRSMEVVRPLSPYDEANYCCPHSDGEAMGPIDLMVI